jgi:uncharacterized membrane protein required for colicin V production
MTFFDLIVIAIVVATFALFAGLVVAGQSYEWAGGWLRSFGVVGTRAAADVAGFLLVVFLFLCVGFAAGALLRDTLRRAKLGWLDRALGASFGCLRGAAVCSAMYLALTAFPVRLGFVRDARTAPALAEGARVLSLVTSSDLRARFLAEYRLLSVWVSSL